MAKKRQQKIHTYKEYREKYGKKFDSGKLEFISLKDASKLDEDKKYWKIEDENPGYYEVSNKPWLIPVIVIGSIAAITAAVVPSVLLTRSQPTPPPEPVVEYCDFKFTGTGCAIKVGGEFKKEHTFSLEKGKKPTETYNILVEGAYELPTNPEVLSIITYTKVDEHNGTISFNDKINENAVLELAAVPITNRASLTVTGENCKVVVGGEKTSSHAFIYTRNSKPTESISLIADDNYSFPESQDDLPDYLKYTKNDDANATLSFVDNITGNTFQTISAEQPAGDYSFTFTGTDCTLNNLSSYPAGTSVNLTLEPKDAAYDVPEHIAVKINDVIQTEGDDYTYTINDTSASLLLTVTGDVEVEALAHEKDLALTLTVHPSEGHNKLGFAFQCTPKGEEPDPTVDKISVDWGDGTGVEEISAPSKIDDVITAGGGMFQYVGSYNPEEPAPLPDTDDFKRHVYSTGKIPQEGYTVKFYGDINNIAFGFPYPNDATSVIPWGTINDTISSVTTYCNLPAEHINSSAGQGMGIDFDTYVVFSSEVNLSSVNFALGTTKVPNGCCCKARGITSVDIQDTVTEIGDNAFCEAGLTEVFIPDSVTKIGYDAFKCYGDSPKQLEDGVTFGENSKLEEIGMGAFTKCKFATFDLPDSVTTIYGTDAEEGSIIPFGAFEGCEQLETFNIGDNTKLNYIGQETFQECPLLSEFNLPDTITKIGNLAFDGCSALESIAIPKNVNNIEGNPFSSCVSLASIIVDSENAYYKDGGVNAIITKQQIGVINPNTLVSGCNTTTIPDDITSIGACAFAGCATPYVVIEDTVTSIGDSAFDYWENTQSIYFPDCLDDKAITDKYGNEWYGTGQPSVVPNQYPPEL